MIKQITDCVIASIVNIVKNKTDRYLIWWATL